MMTNEPNVDLLPRRAAVSRRRWLILALGGLTALGAICAIVFVRSGADVADRSARDNTAILDSLSLPLDVERLELRSVPQRRGESGPVVGAGTIATYSSAALSSSEILGFFEEELESDWRVWLDTFPCHSLDPGQPCTPRTFLRSTRGPAFVSVDTGNVETLARTFEIYVDADADTAALTPAATSP